ncbi:MAG: cell wall-binding repeat-containing protein, partial [Solirubrobacteraceae bacterium]|nr:cell wall-binding repeat-containing protein [Solirubrobacteraceae bacterium]
PGGGRGRARAGAARAAGGGDDDGSGGPDAPVPGAETPAAEASGETLGFPYLATKNTTRVAGADPAALAAGSALAVFPATGETTRPPAVTLVPAGDWRAAIAASVLVARPVRAPVLMAEGDALPDVTRDALARLAPRGSGVLGGTQVIRVGDVPAPEGLRATAGAGADPFALAAAIDRLAASARGEPSDTVLVVGSEAPAYAMPAAAWAAKSGDPVLFTEPDRLPEATAQALRRHDDPRIVVLGPPSAVSARVVARLGRYGTVERLDAPTPQEAAVAFARHTDGAFGWGLVDPGHGLQFANPSMPAAAAAAAPLASAGTYGALLLVAEDGSLPDPVVQFLLDIQPGYEDDPVRGVYNHGWLIGDEGAIGLDAQSRIDALLEISPVTGPSS